jgi:hypothetical protein
MRIYKIGVTRIQHVLCKQKHLRINGYLVFLQLVFKHSECNIHTIRPIPWYLCRGFVKYGYCEEFRGLQSQLYFISPNTSFELFDASGTNEGFCDAWDLAEHSHMHVIHVILTGARKIRFHRAFGLATRYRRAKMPKKTQAVIARTRNLLRGRQKAPETDQVSDSEMEPVASHSGALHPRSSILPLTILVRAIPPNWRDTGWRRLSDPTRRSLAEITRSFHSHVEFGKHWSQSHWNHRPFRHHGRLRPSW